MGEVRHDAVVIGPGSPGFLKVVVTRVREGTPSLPLDVPIDRIPASLRVPNSRFVAIVSGREILGVEPADQMSLQIQNAIRPILNTSWDPIHIAGVVDDEYDGYIGAIYVLLRRRVTDETLARHLLKIEVEAMGLNGAPMEHLLRVAAELKRLELPYVE